MWPYFLVRVIMWATAFWTFCRQSTRNVGSPYNSELALSSLEVVNAWFSFLVSAGDKQSLILLMFLRWKKQALQVFVTCLSSEECSLKITPMFLAEGDGLIHSPDTSTYSFDGGGQSHALRTSNCRKYCHCNASRAPFCVRVRCYCNNNDNGSNDWHFIAEGFYAYLAVCNLILYITQLEKTFKRHCFIMYSLLFEKCENCICCTKT